MGLKPIIRRTWAPKGQTPEAIVDPRYQWFYLYAFAHPASGRSFWLVLPRVDSEVFSIALEQFAQTHVEFGSKEVLLVLDRAGWHTSGKVQWPDGIHPMSLPPYSPQLQPAERLWQLSDQPFVNRTFDSIEEMEEVAAQRCRQLMDSPDQVKGLIKYYWWPDDPPVCVQ